MCLLASNGFKFYGSNEDRISNCSICSNREKIKRKGCSHCVDVVYSFTTFIATDDIYPSPFLLISKQAYLHQVLLNHQ